MDPDYYSVRSDASLIQRIVDGLFDRDASLWPSSESISDIPFGWIDAPERMIEQYDGLYSSIDLLRTEFKNLIVIGQGGSTLGARSIIQFSDICKDSLVSFIDSTHPETILRLQEKIEVDKTLFVVSSKSGSTVETLNLFEYFYDFVRKHINEMDVGSRFVAITDPGSPLEKMAVELSFRDVINGYKDVGGRYSVLTPFGLYPAAFQGVNIKKILEGALEAKNRFITNDHENDLFVLINFLVESLKNNRSTTLLIPDESLTCFSSWIEQLLAESLGKSGKGIFPVIGSKNRNYDFLKNHCATIFVNDNRSKNYSYDTVPDSDIFGNSLEVQETLICEIADGKEFGEEIMKWEVATAILGSLIEVNPFDQPQVEEAKASSRVFLRNREAGGKIESNEISAIKELLDGLIDKDYIAILAYLAPSDYAELALAEFKDKLMNMFAIPVTYAFGPAYLHSTGQFHKGGPPTGKFIQLIDNGIQETLVVPGRDYNFHELIKAQADGDFDVLVKSGKKIVRINVEKDLNEKLKQIVLSVTAG